MSLDPMTAPLAYLATPYSKYPGGIEKAFVDASALAGRLMVAGVKIYSPIAHTHVLAVHAGLDPMDHSIWLPFDEAMMKASGVLIVAHMEGWWESFGIDYEVKFFRAAGKPIFDLDPRTLVMTRRSDTPNLNAPCFEFAHGKTPSEHAAEIASAGAPR